MPRRMQTPTRMPATSPLPRSPSPKSSSQCGGGGGGSSGEGMAGGIGARGSGGSSGGPLIEFRRRTPTFGRGLLYSGRIRAAGCAYVRVPCLRPSAASPRGADEAHRPRDARVRRGRRRLGGWWPPSGAAAFRVEKEFRVPPASVQRGGGAASSPLRFRPWRQRPERPESATTEER